MLVTEHLPLVERTPSSSPRDETANPVDALPWKELADATGPDVLERLRHAQLRARILGVPSPSVKVGRFSVLHTLGAGGMGTVYAAYDDELERKVALKFLHSAQANDDHAIHRLLREAQALAKLSHPNLVAIYDVGRWNDRVYLAMELVPGVTMRQWVEDEDSPRPWREVLARWLEVSRALVAVHAAGMIHRDIKPDNVLIGEDGRARLADFGLARAHATVDEAPSQDDARSAGDGSRLEERVTQTHAVVGTPAYMAPEVRAGEPASEASDQYSLCVSICESLYGARPRRPTQKDSQLRVPDRSSVPTALRRVLSRGLSMEPGDRHPSIGSLQAALWRISGRRRRRRLMALGAVALTTAAAAGGTIARSTEAESVPTPPCAGIRDDLDGAWDEPRRAAVLEAIEATALPYGPTLGRAFVARLDAYGREWLDARQRVCEATRVDHRQSDTLLDRRMACLDGQRTSMSALVDATLEAEPTKVSRLPLVLAELPRPADCEEATLAQSRVEPPPPEQLEAVTRMRTAIAEIRTTAKLRGSASVLDRGLGLRDEAEALGYGPLLAEAELLVGLLLRLADDPRTRHHLGRAETLAEGLGDDLLKHDALRQSADIAASMGTDLEADLRVWSRLRATVRRLGDPPIRLARAQQPRALLSLREGDHATAEATLREEVARWDALGERFDGAQALAWRVLGDVLSGRGRFGEAQEAFAEATRLDARWGGAAIDTTLSTTRLGKPAYLQAVAAMGQGRLDDASTLLHESLRQTAEAYGDDSVSAGRVRVALAALARARGRVDEATEHARSADANFRRWLGDDHIIRASALSALGTLAFDREQADAACRAFAEALRLQRSALPSDHVDVALARSNLGEALVLAGRDATAIPHLHAALTVMQQQLDPDDDTLSYPLHALAEIALRRGDRDEACTLGQRALEIRTRNQPDPVELSRTRWLVARCLDGPERRADAESLARQARSQYVALGADFNEEVEAIDAFLRR